MGLEERVIGAEDLVGVVDVHYADAEGWARAALVVCKGPELSEVLLEQVSVLKDVADYEPGALYKRELPCIRAVLAEAAVDGLKALVVDGYATLDPLGRFGLGAHAAAAFGLAVIGVAKTPYRPATHAIEVLRGEATRPLYVTGTGGISDAQAATLVATMAGPYRIPSAIARVDALARGRADPITPQRASQ